jgi:hypothetical protein
LNHQGANDRWDNTGRHDAGSPVPDLMNRIGVGLQALAGLVVASLHRISVRARRARGSRFDLHLGEGQR